MGSSGRTTPPGRRPREIKRSSSPGREGRISEARPFLAVVAVAIGFLAFLAYAGIVSSPTVDAPFVDLADPERIAEVRPSSQPDTLRIVLAAVTSPVSARPAYEALAEYLSERLGRPVRLDQPATYAAANELLRSGAAALGFICTLAYVDGREEFGLRPLAVPQIAGSTTYRSLILVPAGSTPDTLSDLRGAVFAYTDPLSFSGYLSVRFLLAQQGESAESFFGRTTFTGSHDRSVRSVAQGLFDGAAVDSLVYDAMVAQDPSLASRVRVLAASREVGSPPVVVGPFVSQEEATRLAEILLAMEHDPVGREVLEALGVDRFVRAHDESYDPIRAMRAALGRSSGR